MMTDQDVDGRNQAGDTKNSCLGVVGWILIVAIILAVVAVWIFIQILEAIPNFNLI